MTTAHPPESRSADSTAVSDEGQAPPLVHEMAPGQRFPSPNQVDMERGPFWRAGLLPESPWEAHPVTIIANLGEPIGESRFKEALSIRETALGLARISQTHLGGVSSGADEPGCGSICVALRQSGPGLIVCRVFGRLRRVMGVAARVRERGAAAALRIGRGRSGSAIAGRRVADRGRRVRTWSARESPRPWRT